MCRYMGWDHRILLVRIAAALNKETKSSAEAEGTCDIILMLASSIVTEVLAMILVCCEKIHAAPHISHTRNVMRCYQILTREMLPDCMQKSGSRLFPLNSRWSFFPVVGWPDK